MSESPSLLNELSEEAVWRLEEICCRFEKSWLAGHTPRPEDFLGDAEGAERLAILRELLRLDVFYRDRAGERPSPADYAVRFSDASNLLSELFPEVSQITPAPAVDRTLDEVQRTGPYVGVRSWCKNDAAGADDASNGKPSPSTGAPSRFRVLRFHAEGGLGEPAHRVYPGLSIEE